ncbi:MAG: HAMP domain-containing sensor histidine kinase [Candidatus Omnitrophota bacterium]
MVTHLKTEKEERNLTAKETSYREEIPHNLSHMEKMASIGQLSFSVAHEMRNLLGMIRNAAFNIDRALRRSDASVQNNLEIINRSINRAREFIDNLLNLSHASSKTEEVIDVSHIVDNLLSLFSKELEWRKIELYKNYQPLPLFRIDRNALQECLLNLILNAIQSMDEGGIITITLESWKQGLRISIMDEGCGIPEEVQEKIFDRFYTTKRNGQGTGLGLTIARSIAREQGGDITVKSRVGKGSTFSICLPSLAAVPEHPGPR